ncbi:YkvI family membrane protein [Gleimia hominis]|uniref:YkvI family membrane protein n=1 Tax=Gleimia hominis TaxID=595468 RepID=UPI0018EDE76B|nr:hypothetical protein [Gleimia hominis]WIK65044.1 hypothetical protein CJ187_003045 [Gleimia hominis]
MFKKIIKIAMAFLGMVVGAGFASGQELLQYFVAFGKWGVVGAVITGIVMAISGDAILQLGSYYRAREHKSVLDEVTHPIVSWILDGILIFTLFCFGFVMIAGGGANLNQQFGLPIWVGAALMAVLVIAAGFLDVDKVTTLIGAITPLIVVLLVLGAGYAISQSDLTFTAAAQAASKITPAMPPWWLSAINYVGLALVLAISMALVMGGDQLNTRAAGLGGVAGGSLFGVLLVLSAVGLLSAIDKVRDADLPMLALMDAIHPTVGVIMAIVIYLMIFNTAIGIYYALAKRAEAVKPSWFRPALILSTLAGFVFSFLGFKSLISWLFPILGYLGVAMVAILVVSWLRSYGEITEEHERRERVRDLIQRKLHPRKRFQRKHRTELTRTIEDSNVENSDLSDQIHHEVATELVADSDVEEFTEEEAQPYLLDTEETEQSDEAEEAAQANDSDDAALKDEAAEAVAHKD